jgi:hypothetical protein
MKIEYSYCGHIATDINYIECKKDELAKALKKLEDNLSQVARITLKIGKQTVYIYHEKCSGYKRASKKRIETYDEATAFACGGIKRTQYYTKLKGQIEKLLSASAKTDR